LSSEELKLKEELCFYESKKDEWLEQYNEKFLLIKGNELIDFFESFSDAYKDGVKRFGNTPFFIKQVVEVDPIERIPSLMLGLI